MIVADASVWIAVFPDDDINHDRSYRRLQDAVGTGQRIAGPTLLPPEVAGAIRRRTKSPDPAPRVLANLLSHPSLELVPLNAELAVRAARLAADLQLRRADAVYVAVA